MNIIQYRGCPLQVLRSNPWVREVILDESGTSYKWTKWTISAIVTYNPDAISYAPSPGTAGPGRNPRGAGGAPDSGINAPRVGGVASVALGAGSGPERMPADTDVAIRRFLEFPRGPLVVFSTDMLTGRPTSVMLRSPVQNPDGSLQPCDANNGPFCKVNSIQEVAGERLWQIHLTFETYIYEDSLRTGQSPPTIVSNRWSITVDTNWQHLTTRIIEGIVHFRADLMLTEPDSNPAETFRGEFANFTVPAGFQRTQVLCKTLPQGNQIAYRIVDTDQPYQKNSTAALQSVRLEYKESSWMWQGSFGRAVGQTANWAATNPVTAIAMPQVLAAQGLQFGLAQLPKRYKTVIARAWGNRNMPRATLVGIAMSVANARMGTAGFIDTSTNECIVTYSSAQMMAQVQSTSRWSFSESAGMLLLDLVNLSEFFGDFPSVGIGDLTLMGFAGQDGAVRGGLLRQQANTANTPFPNDSGTRGTWSDSGPGFINDSQMFSRLLTQTLEGIGTQSPGAPP